MTAPLQRLTDGLRAAAQRPVVALGGVLALVVAIATIGASVGEPPVDAAVTAAVLAVEPTAEPDVGAPAGGGEVGAAAPRDDVASETPAEPEPAPAVGVPAPAPEPTAEPAPAQDPDRIPLAAVQPGHEAFAGLSTWIDVYDVEWTPQQQVDVAFAAGVDTIFLQSARYASEGDIDDPARYGAVIDAAKAKGMQVMAWYIPDFVDAERDLRRSKAAIAYTSPGGNRVDAFGLDIELDHEPDIAVRNARLLDLSEQLRAWTGPDYPMAAVVLPPLQLDLNGTWWPGFPYAELRPHYDAYIPMSYSSYRGTDAEKTYSWNLENVLETRRRAGDPDLPVHLAGGIADNLPEVAAFVAAARDGNVTGAGLYDLHTTRSSAWPALQALRLTPGTAPPIPSLVD
jgi:hypothetical protein